MQTEWVLDASLGDGINQNTVIPQNNSRIPHGPPLYDFILNFQPFFMDWHAAYNEEFVAFDWSDAIAQTLARCVRFRVRAAAARSCAGGRRVTDSPLSAPGLPGHH